MTEFNVKISEDKSGRAYNYLFGHLQDSKAISYFRNVMTYSSGSISIVSSLECNVGQTYESSCGGRIEPCSSWLIKKIALYVQGDACNAVLFEDLNSRPSDPYLKIRSHPQFWQFGDRLLWPVLSSNATTNEIEEARNWASSLREAIFFVRLDSYLRYQNGLILLNDSQFQAITSSISYIVTDVFDGESLMVWSKKEVGIF